ncbi:putative ATP-grasp superfamily ATP-dependent carboligase [Kineococcus xinjiangensis]|uniref:Putative ATP-grasp superfamily ATP-dependent carboligase n=1 Tax=Kineococcus xinjiangensis TaxID=512762 RepID=A0A2S6IW26_9ACTN|nr:PAC2 family protein [Kineococcus xinjiangensis]PPK98440.1 putative ATP-grasp superfamily ATP-dependent carboligase [Kineococcus xinjiangensis]
MLDPAELYRFESPDDGASPVMVEPPLVVALSGFVDAGSGVRLAVDHLLQHFPHEVLARFDVDQLHDYRARRPTMTFATDHWSAYDAPELALRRLHDASGGSFLLLSGPEPDVQWERFNAAFWQLADQVGAALVVVLTAAPTSVPHTRPTGVTGSASRPELLEGVRTWAVEAQVPGHATGLLQFRGAEGGRDVLSLVAHVPHYLAAGEYPDAAAALLTSLGGRAGLDLPVDELLSAAAATRVEVDAQVEASAEVGAVVRALEQDYDAQAADLAGGLVAEGQPIPTADELGAEFERFLADAVDDPKDDGGQGGT